MDPLLQRMHTEHRRFETLLDYLHGSLDSLDADERPDWEDLGVLMEHLRTGLAGRHSRQESRLWERLVRRPDGPVLLLAALRRVQREVAACACDLEDAVTTERLGRAVSTARLRRLAGDFASAMRRQIALEEHALFPFAERLLGPASERGGRAAPAGVTEPGGDGP